MISSFPEPGSHIPWNAFRIARPSSLVTADVYVIPAAIYRLAVYQDTSNFYTKATESQK